MEDIERSLFIRLEMAPSVATTIKRNPIFIASTFLGIFPFRTVNGLLVLDRVLFCHSVLVAAILSFIGFYTFAFEESTSAYILHKALKQCFAVFHFIQHPTCLVFIFLKREIMQKTVNSIQNLKNNFCRMKINTSNSETSKKRFLWFEILQPIVLVLIVFFLTGNIKQFSLGVSLYFLFIVVESAFCGLQFCFLVGFVSEFFETEIIVLKLVKQSVYRKLDIKIMERLIETANQIVSLASNINSFYSFQLLYLIFLRFFLIIIHMYFILHYTTKSFSDNYRNIIGNIMMMSHHFYNNWKVNHASEMASKKVGKLLFCESIKYKFICPDCVNNSQCILIIRYIGI